MPDYGKVIAVAPDARNEEIVELNTRGPDGALRRFRVTPWRVEQWVSKRFTSGRWRRVTGGREYAVRNLLDAAREVTP